MKKTHIAALIMMALALVILVASSRNLSSFVTFEMAEDATSRVKVSGQLSLTDPIDYFPEEDPNTFSFYLIDENNDKRRVVLNQPKPRDFERSESVVVTGKMDEEGVFQASEALLKCPSKYKEEELQLRG